MFALPNTFGSALEAAMPADVAARPGFTDPPVRAAKNFTADRTSLAVDTAAAPNRPPVPGAAANQSSTSTGGHQGAPAAVAALNPHETAGATAREKYRRHVAEALTDWHLFAVSSRPTGIETELCRSAVAEIISMRLRIAYMPIFATLERMQKQLKVAFDPRTDPYGPPVRDPWAGR